MFRCSIQQQCIMDFTRLCFRVLIVLLIGLELKSNFCVFAQNAGEFFPQITPDKQQFFLYEVLNISCEHFSSLTEWRVMQKLNKENSSQASTCPSSAPTCTINSAFVQHSGEYWCKNTQGETSGKINISFTASRVILEVPARPVPEGSAVTLHCKNENSKSNHITDFYKDGAHLRPMYESKLTIQNVSKADEGFYKCKISGVGESPQSWLAVAGTEIHQRPMHPHSPFITWLLAVVGILSVILFFMLIGIYLRRKYKDSGGDRGGDQQQAVYAVVTEHRKDRGCDNKVKSDNVTYATVQYHRGKKELNKQREEEKSSLSKENVLYSVISPRPCAED